MSSSSQTTKGEVIAHLRLYVILGIKGRQADMPQGVLSILHAALKR